MTEQFAEIVGQEEYRTELDCGIVFVHRAPTAKEIIDYKNSIRYRKKGKDFTSLSGAQQVELADKILLDVERLGYKQQDGKVVALGAHVKSEDIAHIKVSGAAPKSWKDLVPALRKTQFIEKLIVGVEDEEKN